MRAKSPSPAVSLVLVLFAVAATYPLGAMAIDGPAAPIRANHQLVERVLRETGVQQKLPGPSWSAYFGEVFAAFLHWALAPLRWFVPTTSNPWVLGLLWFLLAVVVSVLVVWLVRWLVDALRPSMAPHRGPDVSLEPSLAPPALEAGAWRDEIDLRLAQGSVEAALEAVWWWMASSIMTKTIDASWTSRELLAAARRSDLGPEAGSLDRMAYGKTPPSRTELTALVRRLEARLA